MKQNISNMIPKKGKNILKEKIKSMKMVKVDLFIQVGVELWEVEETGGPSVEVEEGELVGLRMDKAETKQSMTRN